MSAEAGLHYLAHQARNLLKCQAASLLLGCPESALRHPLLDQMPSNDNYLKNNNYPARCYGTPDLISLLRNERIRALCDMAMQSGQVQSLNHVHTRAGTITVHSIAVAPLERPAGFLGLLLLVNPPAGAFRIGEHLLLNSYVQTAAQHLEEDLHKPPCSSPSFQSTHNEFVSMVSHELRRPLTAIKGYAGLLQAYSVSDRLNRVENKSGTGEITPARQQQYLDIIMEQANHLEVLIGDLLDVSRIQAGRLALRFCNVNIAELCQQGVQVAQQRIDPCRAEKYHIQCNLSPNLPLVWADPDRVRQVLTNLLENAIKYSPDGGLIEVLAYPQPAPSPERASSNTISISRRPGIILSDSEGSPSRESLIIHVTVRDSGIGIPQEQQSLLFQPFNRLEHPSTQHIPGTGLGLYITRKIVEAMGGNVTLHSTEGQGTSVTFTLLAAALTSTIPEQAPSARKSANGALSPC